MIPRYSRPEMVSIWEPQTRFKIWFEIEAHACDALAEIGVIPKESAKNIWEKAGNVTFDVDRIDEIERVTKHDVIAFLTHLAEFIGPDSRFVHQTPASRCSSRAPPTFSSRMSIACSPPSSAAPSSTR
jgi:adenylosuccinate lyase